MTALAVVGTCMAPAIAEGTHATFSKTAKFGPGDIVVIWFRPEYVKDGSAPCALKRLTLAIPPLRHADARFYDVFSGAKSHVSEISVGQYCNQDPVNYLDEPFTITAYFTSNIKQGTELWRK